MDDVLLYTNQIDSLITSLETCEYKSSVFKDVLDQIQKLIDDLNLRSYSNLAAWVMDIDSQVGGGWFNRERERRERERERVAVYLLHSEAS